MSETTTLADINQRNCMLIERPTVLTDVVKINIFLFLQGSDPRPKGDYRLEFTTDQFSTNSDSELIVNLPNLDRDPPGQPMLMLQVS